VEILEQRGKAIIHSSRRDRKTKAIAEALAMIPDAHPELDSIIRVCPTLKIDRAVNLDALTPVPWTKDKCQYQTFPPSFLLLITLERLAER
jgi:hypothetical protein